MIPEVTIVVPSFNSGKFLNLTLQSILKQTVQNFECIVVNDCSSDDSISKAGSFFKDTRFRLIHHKMNVGLSGSRNTGLRAAKAPFVAFLDSDDLMMPNSVYVRLAACKWAVRRSDRFAGSYCGSIQIAEEVQTPPLPSNKSFLLLTLLTHGGFARLMQINRCYARTCYAKLAVLTWLSSKLRTLTYGFESCGLVTYLLQHTSAP